VKNSTIFRMNRLLRQLNLLRNRGLHALTILVVLELALLSPLSCVLHCLIQEWLISQSATNYFLCVLHPGATTDQTATEPTPIETARPRAIYESLPPLALALLAIVPLILLVIIIPQSRPPTCDLSPPTPPPRAHSLRFSLT